MRRQRSLLGNLKGLNVLARFPVTEILLDNIHRVVEIQITAQADSHIIRTIVLLIERLDILQTRVLEVLRRTDNLVLTVRNIGIEDIIDRQQHLTLVIDAAHVILLIHSLQLGVETANNQVLEAVGLNHRPATQLTRRNHLMVAGAVIARVGIETRRTDSLHQLIELIGNRDLRSFVGERVNQMIDSLALGGVRRTTVNLV